MMRIHRNGVTPISRNVLASGSDGSWTSKPGASALRLMTSRSSVGTRCKQGNRSPRHPVTRSPRRGFTLIEVLLALALVMVLVGAIYAATSIYQTMTTAGRDEVERSQIVRAVHRKFSSDIHSTVFYLPPEEEESNEDEEGAVEGEEEQIQIEVQDPTESFLKSAKGIVGDETFLTLHVSRPPRDGNYATQKTDLGTITYRLASDEGDGLSQAIVQKSGQSGLARVFGDRITLDPLAENGDDTAIAAYATVLAPEVKSLRFAYWDGTTWQTSWNSEELGVLPRAISITIGLQQRDAAGDISDTLKEYTFVVTVPISDPTPPEALELDLGF